MIISKVKSNLDGKGREGEKTMAAVAKVSFGQKDFKHQSKLNIFDEMWVVKKSNV